jgi:hypothetical protein
MYFYYSKIYSGYLKNKELRFLNQIDFSLKSTIGCASPEIRENGGQPRD